MAIAQVLMISLILARVASPGWRVPLHWGYWAQPRKKPRRLRRTEHRAAAILAGLFHGHRFQVICRRRLSRGRLRRDLILEVVGHRRSPAALGILEAAEERTAAAGAHRHCSAAFGANNLDFDGRNGTSLVVDGQCITALGVARAADEGSAAALAHAPWVCRTFRRRARSRPRPGPGCRRGRC